MPMYPRFFKVAVVLLACGILAVSCGGPKIATADEQMARGEFFDAANTYRKLYNKYKRLTKGRFVARLPSRWPNAIREST